MKKKIKYCIGLVLFFIIGTLIFSSDNSNLYAKKTNDVDKAIESVQNMNIDESYSKIAGSSDFEAQFVKDMSYAIKDKSGLVYYGQAYYPVYIPNNQVVFCIAMAQMAGDLIEYNESINSDFSTFDVDTQNKIKEIILSGKELYLDTSNVEYLAATQLDVWSALGETQYLSPLAEDRVKEVEANRANVNIDKTTVEYFNTKGQDLIDVTNDDIKSEVIDPIEPEVTGTVPEISGNESVYIKLGTEIDNEIFEAKAIDKEDGDITDKIIYDTSKVDLNKQGVYPVFLTITDSDKNKVSIKSEVLVGKEELPVDGNSPIIVANDASYLEQDGTKKVDDVTKELLNAHGFDLEDGIIEDVKITSVKSEMEKKEYIGTSDILEIDEYDVTLLVTDSTGNESNDIIKLLVGDENINPEIKDPFIISNEGEVNKDSEINEITYETFDAKIYNPDINEIISNEEANIQVNLDQINIEEPGKYLVTLTSTYKSKIISKKENLVVIGEYDLPTAKLYNTIEENPTIISNTSIDVHYDVEDEDNLIKENLKIELWSSQDVLISSEEAEVGLDKNIVFSDLDLLTTYKIKIIADLDTDKNNVVDQEKVVLSEEEYTTLGQELTYQVLFQGNDEINVEDVKNFNLKLNSSSSAIEYTNIKVDFTQLIENANIKSIKVNNTDLVNNIFEIEKIESGSSYMLNVEITFNNVFNGDREVPLNISYTFDQNTDIKYLDSNNYKYKVQVNKLNAVASGKPDSVNEFKYTLEYINNTESDIEYSFDLIDAKLATIAGTTGRSVDIPSGKGSVEITPNTNDTSSFKKATLVLLNHNLPEINPGYLDPTYTEFNSDVAQNIPQFAGGITIDRFDVTCGSDDCGDKNPTGHLYIKYLSSNDIPLSDIIGFNDFDASYRYCRYNDCGTATADAHAKNFVLSDQTVLNMPVDTYMLTSTENDHIADGFWTGNARGWDKINYIESSNEGTSIPISYSAPSWNGESAYWDFADLTSFDANDNNPFTISPDYNKAKAKDINWKPNYRV